uniref:Uncharacterized protein n=1 Tax=Alexandrium monilatum TaxID=311494 RepID=A0A7S4W3J7_9DINO
MLTAGAKTSQARSAALGAGLLLCLAVLSWQIALRASGASLDTEAEPAATAANSQTVAKEHGEPGQPRIPPTAAAGGTSAAESTRVHPPKGPAKRQQVMKEAQLVEKERHLVQREQHALREEEELVKREEANLQQEQSALQSGHTKEFRKLARAQEELTKHLRKSALEAQKLSDSERKQRAQIDGLPIEQWEARTSQKHDKTIQVHAKLAVKAAALERQQQLLEERKRRVAQRQLALA